MNRKGVSFAFGVIIGLIMLVLVILVYSVITLNKTGDAVGVLDSLSGDTTKSCETHEKEAQKNLEDRNVKDAIIHHSLEFSQRNCRATAEKEASSTEYRYFTSQETPEDGLFCCLYVERSK